MTDANGKRLQIGPAVIGPGCPVYVVAEAGVNHDGQVGVARELIHAAADAEADAVKFQVFSAERVVTRNAPAVAYQRRAVQATTQYQILSRLELTRDEFADLAAYAGQCGVEFLATPFAIEDLEFLVSIGVRAIKLASTDIINGPLLDAAAETGLPVIGSTGAADYNEVAAAVKRLKRPGAGPLALLHCISSYPTGELDANLGAIDTLARAFDCVSGFSDHTESLTIGGYAAAAGARIIEKHLTLDRNRPGPDHAFSLEPGQMAKYIHGVRYAEQLLGDGAITIGQSEYEVRELARGSVVAARDIHAGETLIESMLTIKRSGGGITPADLGLLVGRQATAEIPADTPIQWDAVSPIKPPEPRRTKKKSRGHVEAIRR